MWFLYILLQFLGDFCDEFVWRGCKGAQNGEFTFSVPIPPADWWRKCIFEVLSSLPHSHYKGKFPISGYWGYMAAHSMRNLNPMSPKWTVTTAPSPTRGRPGWGAADIRAKCGGWQWVRAQEAMRWTSGMEFPAESERKQENTPEYAFNAVKNYEKYFSSAGLSKTSILSLPWIKIRHESSDLNIENSLKENFFIKSAIFSARNSVMSVLFFKTSEVK